MTVPSDIASLINRGNCWFNCIPAPIQQSIQTYLMAYIAGGSMDPNTLAKEAHCFKCLDTDSLMRVKLYLLTLIDPAIERDANALIESAKCYSCVPYGMLQSIETALLVDDPSGPGVTNMNELAALAKCFNCLGPQTQLEVQVYLLATLAGVDPDPNALIGGSTWTDPLGGSTIRYVVTRGTEIAEDHGGIGGGGGPCVFGTAPSITNQVYGTNPLGDEYVLITFDATACPCTPNPEWVLYGTNNPDGSGGVEVNTTAATVTGGYANDTISIPLPVPAYAYFYVTIRCGAQESADSGLMNAYNAAPLAIDWADRVEVNGGARPSNSSITAVGEFLNSLLSCGIFDKMIGVNVYAPDGLIAAITPLIVGPGSDPWTSFNFVAGDLTINGLKGNIHAFQKYLDTGIDPTDLTNSDYGMTLYVSEASSLAEDEIGVFNAGYTDGFGLLADNSGTAYWDASYSGGAGRISAANPGWEGYLSGNRVANNDAKMFRASGVVPHAQLGATNSNVIADTRAAFAGANIFVHAINDGANNQNSSKRLSFAAIHDGLDATESECLYNAVQALRVALGGGFVPDPTDAEEVAIDWAARVVVNGGAMPSQNSIDAAQAFWQTMIDEGLYTKIKALNFYAPDSLTAAITPFIVGTGNDPWTNNGPFVGGDLTVDGLTGNGSTKYLSTGLVPNVLWPNGGAGGNPSFTVYCLGVGKQGSVVGSLTSGLNNYLACPNTSNNIEYGCGGAVQWQDIMQLKGVGFEGFVSGNKLASRQTSLYSATTDRPFRLIDRGAGVIDGTTSSLAMFAHAVNVVGIPTDYSNQTVSFIAFHEGLTEAEALILYNAVQTLRAAFGGGYIATPADPDTDAVVSDWDSRVQANGGGALSTTTKNAAKAFLDALVTAGIYWRIRNCNIIAPDDLIAAITPLRNMDGNDPWTNTNFVGGDLTVNGLIGNGSSKRLDTGVVPTADFQNWNLGLVAYIYDYSNPGAVGKDVFARDNGDPATSGCRLGWYSGGIYFDCWNGTVGQGRINVAEPLAGGGYRSAQALFHTTSAIYEANGANPHAASVSSTVRTGGSGPSNGSIPAFCGFIGGSYGQYIAWRVSFLAIIDPLTQSEDSDLFDAVQALRTSLGGGYV